jgi:hypothetical protein
MGIYAKRMLLFGHEMEIPLEIFSSLFLPQSTVLTVMAFEPGEVAFQAVS